MSVKLIVDNIEVPVKFIKFSDGGSNVKLEIPEQFKQNPPSAYYSLTVNPTTPVDNYLWEITLLENSLYNTGWIFRKKILNLPYLPHARADRKFEDGNAIPLECFISSLNISSWDELNLTDTHSNKVSNYLQNLSVCNNLFCWHIKQQYQCFIETVRDVQSGDVLIAPDNGALKKIYSLQQALDVRTISTFVVEASKERDKSTGRVISTSLSDNHDISGKVCYIVDDICDGGGTFIPLAELLKQKGAKEVRLYVTHGIFAKGLNVFKGCIDKIYAYQTIGTYVNQKDILDFNNGLEVK